MKKSSAIVSTLALGIATPAWGCGAHPMPYFFLLDRPPSSVPKGAIVAKVAQVRTDKNGFTHAQVLKMAGSLGRRLRVRLDVLNGSTCVGLGRTNRPAYVVGFPGKSDRDTPVLNVIAYTNVWWSFLPRWFGKEVWVPSEPAP